MAALKNKIVTIFGGSGFVGRHLTAALVREGAVIRVATRHKNSCYNLRTGALVGQVVPIEVDYNSDTSLKSAIKGSDYVVNLIGILHENQKDAFTRFHVDLPTRIAKIAKREKIGHLVQISALGADEHSESAYQRSKAAGEKAVLKAFKTATVLRPSIIFGEGDGFFSRFARMGRLLPVLPLIGGGKTKFQPVYVGDVVDAILMALAHHHNHCEHFEGKIIECAGPHVYSFKTLLQYISEQTGKHPKLITLPWKIAALKGRLLEKLPGKILTADQVKSLKIDNIETGAHLTLEDVGIVSTPIEVIVPDYLEAYRSGGQFSRMTDRVR